MQTLKELATEPPMDLLISKQLNSTVLPRMTVTQFE